MIEQFTSPVLVNNSQELWLVGEGVVVSGGVAIPSLDLNFVAGTLPSTVTFTRASTATFFNSAGVLTSAAINVPRFDYNPSTLAARGLLVEEARTNSIRNNTMQGAVAGTPGTLPTNWNTFLAPTGITRTVVGTGTSNGITYIDIRFNGTASGAGELTIFPEASGSLPFVAGTVVSNSAWFAIVGGSTSNISNTLIRSISYLGGAYLSENSTAVSLTSTLTRAALNNYTLAPTADRLAVAYSVFVAAAGAINITLRIGLPQLEQGAFATSVIPTTTTALTRSADVASVNTLSPWFNATAGTLYVEAQHIAPSAAVQQFQAQLASGAGDYYGIYKETSPANITARVRSGGADQAFFYNTGVISANTTYKTALGYAVNDFASCSNGGSVSTDTAGALPTSITALGLGQATYTSSVQLNGYLRRVTFYPRRLSNAELQTITT